MCLYFPFVFASILIIYAPVNGHRARKLFPLREDGSREGGAKRGRGERERKERGEEWRALEPDNTVWKTNTYN